MRLGYFVLASLLLISAAAKASDITYQIDLGKGYSGGISVVGYIQTDGALGALTTQDFTDWNLTLTNIYGTVDLNASNSGIYNIGTDMIATPTAITYNFSGTDQGAFEIQRGGSYWILVTSSRSSFPDGFAEMQTVGLDGTGSPVQTIIGTIATVPEPSSVILLLSGLVPAVLTQRKRIGG